MALDNRLRIIGGIWRGRKFDFPNRAGLRPTADRMRETLFNWLHWDIEGARCLDLFAGSGALGFEAASRGAGRVVMVDNDPVTVKALQHTCQLLEAGQMEIVRADFSVYLQGGTQEKFDLVFIDPPFNQGLITPTCQLLEQYARIMPHTRLYIEAEQAALPELPGNWQIIKSARAGQTHGYLLQKPK